MLLQHDAAAKYPFVFSAGIFQEENEDGDALSHTFQRAAAQLLLFAPVQRSYFVLAFLKELRKLSTAYVHASLAIMV